jgi:hypothetical protein
LTAGGVRTAADATGRTHMSSEDSSICTTSMAAATGATTPASADGSMAAASGAASPSSWMMSSSESLSMIRFLDISVRVVRGSCACHHSASWPKRAPHAELATCVNYGARARACNSPRLCPFAANCSATYLLAFVMMLELCCSVSLGSRINPDSIMSLISVTCRLLL